jgi:hypothetical protein
MNLGKVKDRSNHGRATLLVAMLGLASLGLTWEPAVAGEAAGLQDTETHEEFRSQEDPEPDGLREPVLRFGGLIQAMASDGELVWIAQGRYIRAVDPHAAGGPRFVGEGLLLPERVHSLYADAGLAMARDAETLYLLDLSIPAQPRLLSTIALDAEYHWGPMAFFGGDTEIHGWQAFVTYTPLKPGEASWLAVYSARGRRMAIDYLGKNVVVQDLIAAGDLIAVAVVNPNPADAVHQVQLLRVLDGAVEQVLLLPAARRPRLAYAEVEGRRLLYMGSAAQATVRVWDISLPAAPQELEPWVEAWDGNADALMNLVVSNLGEVFVSLLRMEGNSSITTMRRLPPLATVGRSVGLRLLFEQPSADLLLFDDRLFVAHKGGLESLDRAGGDRKILASAMTLRALASGRYAGAPSLFALSSSGLSIYPLSDPSPSNPAAHLAGVEGHELRVGGGRAIIGRSSQQPQNSAQLDIVDLQADGGPALRSRLLVADGPINRSLRFGRFAIREQLLIARSLEEEPPGYGALDLYDLGDAGAPVLRDHIQLPGAIVDFDVQGSMLAVTHGLQEASNDAGQRIFGLSLFSISAEDRASGVPLATLQFGPDGETLGGLPLVRLDGDRAWLLRLTPCDRRLYFQGLDLSDPLQSQFGESMFASIELPHGTGVADRDWPADILLADGHAFLPRAEFGSENEVGPDALPPGAWILDLRRPEAPRFVGRMDHGIGFGSMAVQSSVVDMAREKLGIYRFRPALAWASDAGLPSPSAPPPATAGPSPTPSATRDCRPTATAWLVAGTDTLPPPPLATRVTPSPPAPPPPPIPSRQPGSWRLYLPALSSALSEAELGWRQTVAAGSLGIDRKQDLQSSLPGAESQFGGSIQAMAAGGEQLWVAQGRGLRAVDLRAPGGPRFVSAGLFLPEPVSSLQIDGDKGMALGEQALYRLDLSRPASPRLLSTYPLYRDYDWGPMVYFGGDEKGVGWQAIVAQREKLPDAFGSLAIFDATGLAVKEGILGRGVSAISLITAGELMIAGIQDDRQAIQAFGLMILRREAADFRQLARLDGPAAFELAVAEVEGQPRLYAGDSRGGSVTAWDLGDPAQPAMITQWEAVWNPRTDRLHSLTSASSGEAFALVASRVGLAGAGLLQRLPPSGEAGLAVGIRFASAPPTAPILALGERLLSAEATGLLSMDREGQARETLPSVMFAPALEIGDFSGSPAIFAASRAGLSIYRMSDVPSPNPMVHLAGDLGRELSLGGGLAVIGRIDPDDRQRLRLSIIDLEDAQGPRLRSELLVANGPLSQSDPVGRYLQEGRLLVARSLLSRRFGADALDLYDLGDPGHPVLRDRVYLPGNVVDYDIQDSRLAVTHELGEASIAAGQRIVGLSLFTLEGAGDDLRILPLSTLELGQEADTGGELPLIALDGDRAWLAGMIPCENRLQFYGLSLSNPRAPQRMGGSYASIELPRFRQLTADWPADIRLADGYAFLPGVDLRFLSSGAVQEEPEAAWIIDLRRAEAPRLLGRLAFGIGFGSITVHQRRVYVASGSLGIQSFQPDLAWASDPSVPRPSAPPPATAGPSPTPSATRDCRPTATRTPPPSATPKESATPSPRSTASASHTPTHTPTRMPETPASATSAVGTETILLPYLGH